jgi:hypothetical protein
LENCCQCLIGHRCAVCQECETHPKPRRAQLFRRAIRVGRNSTMSWGGLRCTADLVDTRQPGRNKSNSP